MLSVVVTGSRDWTDVTKIEDALTTIEEEHKGEEIVLHHGACRGADTLAGQVAATRGYKVVEYPADWKRYGKRAGPIRNAAMLKAADPGVVLVFHSDLFGNSKSGTRDCFTEAQRRRKYVDHEIEIVHIE